MKKQHTPVKTLMNLSGLRSRHIKSKSKVHTLDLEKLLETYTSILGLSFETYTVIKEKIVSYKDTGYQPLTLIGGHIYLHCKQNHITLSMKKIAQVLGISSISIQRFVKNDVSTRLRSATRQRSRKHLVGTLPKYHTVVKSGC